MPIPEGSQFGGVPFWPNWRGPNSEGSCFLPIRRGPSPEDQTLPIRRGPNSERSCFYQSGGIPIRRGPLLANLEGSQFGGTLFLPMRRGHNSEVSFFCLSVGVPEL